MDGMNQNWNNENNGNGRDPFSALYPPAEQYHMGMDQGNYTSPGQYMSQMPVPMQPMYDQQGNAVKYCKFCGNVIPADAVICTYCGRQVEMLSGAQMQPQTMYFQNTSNNININNINTGYNNVQMNYNAGYPYPVGKQKDKTVALILCFFLGVLGVHKFYEEKVGMGLLYLFTAGLCGVGVLVDFILLLFKPNPYYV